MNDRVGEYGMSAVLLVVVFVIVTGTAAIMLESSLRGQKESGRQRDRALTISGADTAISRYAAALNAGLVNEQTRYQLRRSAYTAYGSGGFESYYGSKIILHPATVGAKINAGTANETILPGPALVRRGDGIGGETDADPWGFDDYYLETAGGAEASSRFTVEERPDDGGPSLYWQVFRVDPLLLAPKGAGTRNTRNIDVVFRTWRTGTDPRYVKASFAAGRFGDYQVLSDAPIKFFHNENGLMTVKEFSTYYQTGVPPVVANAVSIQGKVHSNGSGASGPAIDAQGVTCKGNTEISSTLGAVLASSSCQPHVKTGPAPAISIGAVRSSMDAVRAECAQRGRFARCFTPGRQYDATITSDSVVVRNRGNGALVETVGLTGRPMGLLFEDDVWVRQSWNSSPPSRVTILADSETSVASIHVVASPNPKDATFGTFGGLTADLPVGLIAQGDVIVEAVNTQDSNASPATVQHCDGMYGTLIRAAIIAETGTLTVPPKWLSYIRQKATPECGQLALLGSLTVRESPVLTMEWTEEDGFRRPFGYQSRTYEWDSSLQSSTPPYFPTTSPWGMSSWVEWSKDCVSPSVTLKAGC